jgi:hypothetical protein
MTNTEKTATAKAIASASEESHSTKPRKENIKKLYRFLHEGQKSK